MNRRLCMYMCVRVRNVYACACVLVAHIKTETYGGGTNSHTCVTCRGHRRIWPFRRLPPHFEGKTIIILLYDSRVSCALHENRMENRPNAQSAAAAAAAGSVAGARRVIFIKTKHFLSSWPVAQMASRTRHSCSVPLRHRYHSDGVRD